MSRRMLWHCSAVMSRPVLPSSRLSATHAPHRYMVLPAPQVGQANPADADRRPELIVDHHLGLMFLSGYIVKGDALDPRDEDVQVGEARVIRHQASGAAITSVPPSTVNHTPSKGVGRYGEKCVIRAMAK